MGVELSYKDEYEFVAWILSLFNRPDRNPDQRMAIMADEIITSLHYNEEAKQYSATFTFRTSEMDVTFGKRLPSQSRERAAAAEAHLDGLMEELTSAAPISRQ
ncbi:hypothetical protein SAMN02982989_3431 [Xaviernesmea oryzae]|uniref:Uncharacterized protein n=1 Tax=Xaviernesmea oryzae TaxID=464029 RepID=A0A1X7G8T1_9HYPH|nr:hypothetical protein SAMN02982989_3431 [Xaviernesmea oryzae]